MEDNELTTNDLDMVTMVYFIYSFIHLLILNFFTMPPKNHAKQKEDVDKR